MSITLEQVLKAYEYAGSHPHKYLRGTTNWCAAVDHALNAEQPAPVLRCSFCYVTDNAGNPWSGHHESVGGKLIYRVMGCKDHKHLVEALDGSKTAPVAVVMPERQIVPDNLMAGLTRKWCEGWNDALEEVARLNGVKP